MATYLPIDKKSYLGVGGPAHLGCGTPEVPAVFTVEGRTFTADRVAFTTDYKSVIRLSIEGRTTAVIGGGMARNLVTVPVKTWDVPTLTLAFAVLAANVVRLNLHVPTHAKTAWQTAAGFAANIVPAAYLAGVNAALKAGGAPFTLAAGTVTNTRVRGGGASAARSSAVVAEASADALAAMFTPPTPPKAGGKS